MRPVTACARERPLGIHSEHAFREYLAALPAGQDGVPVIYAHDRSTPTTGLRPRPVYAHDPFSADDPVSTDEVSDGRISVTDA